MNEWQQKNETEVNNHHARRLKCTHYIHRRVHIAGAESNRHTDHICVCFCNRDADFNSDSS